MRLTDKRIRHVAIGVCLLVTCFLVWWVRVYRPLNDRAHALNMDLSRLALERHQLMKKVKKLSDTLKGDRKADKSVKRLSQVIVQAGSLEETNAMIQAKVQAFVEKNEISLRAYKELPPRKWNSYQIGRIEFQLSASIEKLAVLLEFLEKQEGAVRIERLQIRNRNRRSSELWITLRLGSLFVGETGKSQS